MKSFTLQFETILKSKGLLRDCDTGDGKATDSREIPKGQRFVGRPSLEKLFSQRSPGKAFRDRVIAEAITAHGYSQTEVASFLGLHYSTISRILAVDKKPNVKTLCVQNTPLILFYHAASPAELANETTESAKCTYTHLVLNTPQFRHHNIHALNALVRLSHDHSVD
jgi:Helix-turn-helix